MTFIEYQVRYPYNKLFDLGLKFATNVGVYMDNWLNLRSYSFTLKLSCLRFMNSCIFRSLNSRGKPIKKNQLEQFLNYPTGLSPFHYSYQT